MSDEVQCWDGDGTLPPELVKLMKENEQLKNEVRSRDEVITKLEEEITRIRKESYNFQSKLIGISNILNTREIDDDEKEDWRSGDMVEENFHEGTTFLSTGATASSSMPNLIKQAAARFKELKESAGHIKRGNA